MTKKLPDGIKLSKEQNQYAQRVLHNLRFKEQRDKIVEDIIKNPSCISLFIKMSYVYEEIHQFCCNEPSLAPIWLKKWQALPGIQTDENSTQPFFPVRTINCFDLLCGIYLYLNYKKLIEKDAAINNEALAYLEKAADFGFGLAYTDLLVYYQEQMTNTPTHENLALFQSTAESFAMKHLAPGYYTLATVYLKIAELVSKLSNLNAHEVSYAKKCYYSSAYSALRVAQHLLPYSKELYLNSYGQQPVPDLDKKALELWTLYTETALNVDPDYSASHLISEKNMEYTKLNNEARLIATSLIKRYDLGLFKPEPEEETQLVPLMSKQALLR